MSFVSVIATENFISVVSDGRVSAGSEVLKEDLQKFRLLSNKRFVAFAGGLKGCDVLLSWLDWKDFRGLSAEEVAREMWAAGHHIRSLDHEFMVAFGGIEPNGTEIYTMNFVGPHPAIVKPKGLDVAYSFLHNSHFSETELAGIFDGLIKQAGGWSCNNMREAQIRLNEMVAKSDATVNTITFCGEVRCDKR